MVPPPPGFPGVWVGFPGSPGGAPVVLWCCLIYALNRAIVFSWLFFFEISSIWKLCGMAGRARPRPLEVDSGPGDGGSEGVRGAP